MTAAELARTHAAANAVDRAWSAAEFTALLRDPSCLLAGDARSFVLGRVVLDEAEVLTLATHPAHQRRGLARAGLDRFCALARARGAAEVFLEVAADNAPALALYRAAGFDEAGRRSAYYKRSDGTFAAACILRLPLTLG